MKPSLLAAMLCTVALVPAGQATERFDGREDVRGFIAEMQQRHGFAPDELEAHFGRARVIGRVITLVMPPRDPGVRSWHAYRARFIEPKRIAAGRRFMVQHRTALARAEARYGVPKEVIAAVIGVETIYGKQLGNFGTFSALATLAFDYPPRADLFRRELEELLLLAREENADPLSYRGSYAGALGLPQFLPSSRRRYAVDFDGNGRINLTQSADDAIGSVANFLAEHGWQREQPIADSVIPTGDGLQPAIAAGIVPSLTADEWAARDLQLRKVDASGTGAATFPAVPAALIDLASPDAPTEYRLAYRNFYVITRYNRSSFYATSVMDLAAALAAQP